jgi:hypothetical protein
LGAPQPPGTGPVRLDFNVPTAALGKTSSDWFAIFNEGLYIPIYDVTVVKP